MRIQSIVGGAALALAAVTRAAPMPWPTPSRQGETTFSRDIRPILQAHCAICHSPGGPSPMPLVTREDALPWALQISDAVLARRMPIWNAARGYGAFGNDPTLSPYELDAIARWANGSGGEGAERAGRAGRAEGGAGGAGGAAAHDHAQMTVRGRNGWITGWTFVPGDPLITSATFTSADGSTLGAWVAGDRPARLPLGSAMRIASPVHVEIRRREKTSYETAFTPRASTLQFSWVPAAAARSRQTLARRVRIEHLACGGTLGPADASIIGVRPLLPAGAGAHVTVERIGGAQPVLLGWWRDFDPAYARIYWLARPLDFAANARLTSDAPCELELVLSSRR